MLGLPGLVGHTPALGIIGILLLYSYRGCVYAARMVRDLWRREDEGGCSMREV
jgi:hypothetical protein